MQAKQPQTKKLPQERVSQLISSGHFPKHQLDKKDLSEVEQLSIINDQLTLLKGSKELVEANTFKLNLPTYPLVEESYKKFAERLESFQNWNRFFETLNLANNKGSLIAGAILTMVITTIFVLMLGNPVTLPITLLLTGLAMLGAYTGLIALPTFLYNEYLKPNQRDQAFDKKDELAPKVTALLTLNSSAAASQKEQLAAVSPALNKTVAVPQNPKDPNYSDPLFSPNQQVEDGQESKPNSNLQSENENQPSLK